MSEISLYLSLFLLFGSLNAIWQKDTQWGLLISKATREKASNEDTFRDK
jgi:hypothetical protein